MAGLNHPGCAEYAPNPVEGKTNIAAYEFPTWVAANFETVDEVEAALANSLIIEKPFNEHFPFHIFIGSLATPRAQLLLSRAPMACTCSTIPSMCWRITRTSNGTLPTFAHTSPQRPICPHPSHGVAPSLHPSARAPE